MFVHDQRFYRNENDELMVTIKVFDEDNGIHGEIKIFKYDEDEAKEHLENLYNRYENIEINWTRFLKHKVNFLCRESDRSILK